MRKAPKISLQLFEEKLKPLLEREHFPYDLGKTIDKDLAKVQFDWENWEHEHGECGVKVVNEFPFLLMWAGGDWEYPVRFIIYWDGKQLRGYIPTEGNVFNKETKAAYGNEYDFKKEEVDDKDIPEFDMDKFTDDILNRIQLYE